MREKKTLGENKEMAGLAQSSLHFLLFCCRCGMESELLSWAEPVEQHLRPSWFSAKTDRKNRDECMDSLTSEKWAVFHLLPGRTSSHRTALSQSEERIIRKPWQPAGSSPGPSQPSLCTAAGLIFFIFNQPCKSSVSYQSLGISPKDDSLGFSDSLFPRWTK